VAGPVVQGAPPLAGPEAQPVDNQKGCHSQSQGQPGLAGAAAVNWHL